VHRYNDVVHDPGDGTVHGGLRVRPFQQIYALDELDCLGEPALSAYRRNMRLLPGY
jgi:hypothetical protein